MILNLYEHASIASLQKEFNSVFPYLKIEFFTQSHEKGKGSPRSQLIDVALNLGAYRKKGKNDVGITIHEDQTVAEVEKLFQDSFGLSVQVFRKSGKLWLETTMTDDWTLKKQNEQGKELSYEE